MAHTPIFSMLRRCARLAVSAERANRETSEHVEESLETWRLSRRAFLGATAAATAALMRPVPALGQSKGSRRGRRIAVVGAGMAGLHCAWRLQRAGLDATVYEASSRVGGRRAGDRGRVPEPRAPNGS